MSEGWRVLRSALQRARSGGTRLGGVLVAACALVLAGPVDSQTAADRAFAAEVATAATAVATALAKMRTANKTADVGFYTKGWAVFGGYLRSGQSVSMTSSFDEDTAYIMVAGGDDNATDVDVEVRTESGVRLAADTDADKAAVAGFTCKAGGKYSVRTTMYKARGDSFCVLLMLEVGQKSLSTDALSEALAKWSVGTAALHAAARKAGGQGLTLKHGERDWVLYGAALEDGDSVTYTGLKPGRGRAILYACGDEQATDIDAAVKDEEGNTLEEDTDDDPTPIVQWSPSASRVYKINVSLVSTKAQRSFVLASVLKER